tara:strand:- start:106 stop:282 length:177 start_codon:yes stop_codon:yes gene_type:complete
MEDTMDEDLKATNEKLRGWIDELQLTVKNLQEKNETLERQVAMLERAAIFGRESQVGR